MGTIGAIFEAASHRYLPFRDWDGEARLYMTGVWCNI